MPQHPDLQAELANLRSDLATVQSDLRDIASTLLEKGRESVHAMRNNLNKKVGSSMENIQGYVEQRPMSVMLVAFGVGLLAGRLLMRK